MFSVFGRKETTRISPATCRERFSDGAVMLDVRSAAEVAGGLLACARHADVLAPDFEDRITQLGIDRESPVYVYCQSGHRSGMAAERLRALGYAEAYNVGSYRALAAVGFDTALPETPASDG